MPSVWDSLLFINAIIHFWARSKVWYKLHSIEASRNSKLTLQWRYGSTLIDLRSADDLNLLPWICRSSSSLGNHIFVSGLTSCDILELKIFNRYEFDDPSAGRSGIFWFTLRARSMSWLLQVQAPKALFLKRFSQRNLPLIKSFIVMPDFRTKTALSWHNEKGGCWLESRLAKLFPTPRILNFEPRLGVDNFSSWQHVTQHGDWLVGQILAQCCGSSHDVNEVDIREPPCFKILRWTSLKTCLMSIK